MSAQPANLLCDRVSSNTTMPRIAVHMVSNSMIIDAWVGDTNCNARFCRAKRKLVAMMALASTQLVKRTIPMILMGCMLAVRILLFALA